MHPKGKAGVNIEKAKYDVIRNFILSTLSKAGEMRFDALTDLAVEQVGPGFDGKVVWYMVTVKLDLEARKLIERVPRTSPHALRLVK